MLVKFVIALLGPMLDTLRFIVGPFSIHFCFWHLLLKVVTKTIILLFLDAILITKYLLIFWLKNPCAVNDDFWSVFLNFLIIGAGILSDFVRNFLPGKQTFSYYICAGIDSSLGDICKTK